MDEPLEVPIDGVLDLHTFRPSEIKDLVPDYLAACRERGICQVRIIHGKGIGNLRRTVHAILARHPEVVSFTLDHPEYLGLAQRLSASGRRRTRLDPLTDFVLEPGQLASKSLPEVLRIGERLRLVERFKPGGDVRDLRVGGVDGVRALPCHPFEVFHPRFGLPGQHRHFSVMAPAN